MKYWLVKTEPETYSWSQLVREGRGCWDGVRNFEARNHLRAMSVGDRVLVYHSGAERAVVGVAEVVTAAFPDPTAQQGDWSAVELEARAALKRPVTLATLRHLPEMAELPLLRRARLSVMPLQAEHYRALLQLAGGSVAAGVAQPG